jgi:excinuclease ABC subunit C
VTELERTPERVFLPGRKDPIVLRQNSSELFLLTRLRDEAHRFAITFHRKLRRSRNFQSVLEEIPGIGAGRRKALLRALGSLRRVKEASVEEIARVEGFGPKAAKAVWDFFHAGDAAPREASLAAEPPGVDAAAGAAVPSAEPAAEEAGAPVTEAEIDAALAEEAAADESAAG